MRWDFHHEGYWDHESISSVGIFREVGEGIRLPSISSGGSHQFQLLSENGDTLWLSHLSTLWTDYLTTPPAREKAATFQASIRFPLLAGAERIRLLSRVSGEWEAVFQMTLEGFQSPSTDPLPWVELNSDLQHDEEAFSLLLLGVDYEAGEYESLLLTAEKLTQGLLNTAPFDQFREKISIKLLRMEQDAGHWELENGIFGAQRYALPLALHRLNQAVSGIGHHYKVVLWNNSTYLGGGIYQQVAALGAENDYAQMIFIHELGHLLADLADEYYPLSVNEPSPPSFFLQWAPNVSKDLADLPWREDVNIKIPSRWNKVGYEQFMTGQEERMASRSIQTKEAWDAFMQEENEQLEALLYPLDWEQQIGAFEGAGHQYQGYYRPQRDCKMFGYREIPFCLICQTALQKMLQRY